MSPRKGHPDAADFYLGRGPDARYLGTSFIVDASPEAIEAWMIFQSLDEDPYTEETFKATVTDLLHDGEDPTEWPWDGRTDSLDTPWTYMFDRGTVYVYRYGVEMARIVCNYTRTDRDRTGREPRDQAAHQFAAVIR